MKLVLEQAGAEQAMAAMKVKEEPKEEEIEKKKPEMPPLGDTLEPAVQGARKRFRGIC